VNERILVIRHGALGDVVLSFGPFAAIRKHHPGAHIVLLTTAPYAEFCRASGLFGEIWLDERPPWWRVDRVLALRERLNAGGFRRVYDLQTSDRSSAYFRLFRSPPPEWSGIARGCSHPHANPRRDDMHTVERQAEQLKSAGIADTPPTDLSWVKADAARFSLPAPYVLLVPGGSKHRPEKRWPIGNYAALATQLAKRGFGAAVLGGPDETGIAGALPSARDLTGQTSFADVVALARGATLAVGNDTGPMHLIAAADCPSVVLFSSASDPALCAPRGRAVTVLRKPDLARLSVDEVEAAIASSNRR
jgi:ADP-heptose:LPS heptosyltransferase